MPIAYVTGATGFVGRHLTDVLLENSWSVVAAVRDIDRAKASLGEKVKFVSADLLDPASLKASMPEEVDCVFHVAADTSTWAKEADRQYKINVEGTAALLQAAVDRNARRMVHVSSIVVYGLHPETISDETKRTGAESWVSYVNTKAYAERKVKEAVERGLDAVIVNPTDIVGRYDEQNWVRMIQMIEDDTLPAVPPGNGNFANGRAVAEGIFAAYEKGKTGENYILGGPYATFHEFLSLAAQKLGKPAPKKPVPAFAVRAMARALGLVSAVTGKRPSITREEAYFACQEYTVDFSKAVNELGYRNVPLEQSIDESIAYLREKETSG